MTTPEEVEQFILEILTGVNEDLPDRDQFEVDGSVELFGPNAKLDSLALVSFIVDLEGALKERYDLTTSFLDDEMQGREISPLTNVSTLTSFLSERLESR